MTGVLPRDNRTSLQPTRSYLLPGGPRADRLGEIEVKKLAEIVRGGDDDGGVAELRNLEDRSG